MANIENEDATISDQAERAYNLLKDLVVLQRNKKDTVAGFNAEIKRIKAEIDEILKEGEGEADRQANE